MYVRNGTFGYLFGILRNVILFFMPREGHLQQLLHLFSYLKIHHNARIVFDTLYPDIYEEYFKRHDLSNLYGDDPEAVP